MKKVRWFFSWAGMLLLAMLLMPLAGNAQSIMARDFESDEIGSEGNFFCWDGSFSVAANPAKGGLNTTNNAMKWARAAGEQWAGFGTWTLGGSADYAEMKFLVYQDVADDLRVLVIHDTANGDKELGWYDMPKGVWSEVVVPIPDGGLIMNVVFKAAGGTSAAGDFYVDEIGFYGTRGGGDEPSGEEVIFRETFLGEYRFITANNPGDLAEDASHYYADNLFIVENWLGGAQPWADASGGGMLVFGKDGDHTPPEWEQYEFRIQNINTIGYKNITLSLGMVWNGVRVSYSADGVNWTDKDLPGDAGAWLHEICFTDMPATENLRIKIVQTGGGTTLIDDITIVGTIGESEPPVDDFTINFETKGTAADFWNWAGTDISVVDNPAPGGLNETEKVLKWNRDGEGGREWTAMGSDNLTGFADKEFMKFLVYQNAADDLQVQVQYDGFSRDYAMPKGLWSEIVVPITEGDFKGSLTLKPGGGNPLVFDFYLDQISFFNEGGDDGDETFMMKMDFDTKGSADNFSTWYPENVAVVDNPLKNAVNGTDKVLKWERSDEAWSCLLTDNHAGSTNYNRMKVVIYHNIADGLKVSVEDRLNTDLGDRNLGDFDIPKGVWTEIIVPIPAGGFGGNLAFRTEKGNSCAGDFYFDEIAFFTATTPPPHPDDNSVEKMNFETLGTANDFFAYGSDVKAVVDNPSKDAVNGTDKALKWERNGAENAWGGFGTWQLTGSSDYEKIRFLAYQNVGDDLNMLVLDNTDVADRDLETFAFPKGVWTEFIVTIPSGGLKPNVVFKPAGGTSLVGDFYIDEISYYRSAAPVTPDVPTGLASTAVTATSVSLSWTAVTNTAIAKYAIYRSAPGSTETSINAGEVTSGTAFVATGLESSSTYSFAVKAIGGSGLESALCASISATTVALAPAPNVPTGLASSAVTEAGVTLSWTAVTNTTVAEYVVYRSVAGETDLDIQVAKTDQTEYVITGLAAASTYKFAVKAVGADSQASALCTAISVTTLAASIPTPDAPTGLTASNVTDRSATLSWNAVTNVAIAKYEVYHSIPGGTALEIMAGEVTSGTTLNVTNLTDFSIYKFAVRAYSTDGKVSEFCTAIEVVTNTIGIVDNATIGITIANGLIVLSEAADVTITSIGGAVSNYGIVSEVNISALPAGIYILKAGNEVVKFVK